MPLFPIGKQILVQKIPPPHTLQSNIIELIIPDQYIRKSNQGIVKAIGPDVTEVEVGWYICFEEMRGLDVNDKHGEYHLVDEDDVECRIEIEPEIIDGVYHKAYVAGMGAEFVEATLDSIFSCIISHFAEKKDRVVQSVKESR